MISVLTWQGPAGSVSIACRQLGGLCGVCRFRLPRLCCRQAAAQLAVQAPDRCLQKAQCCQSSAKWP